MLKLRDGQILVNEYVLPESLRNNRPSRDDADEAAEVIDMLIQQRDSLFAALLECKTEPGAACFARDDKHLMEGRLQAINETVQSAIAAMGDAAPSEFSQKRRTAGKAPR